MPAKAVRILVVGPAGPHVDALLERLARNGWGSYSVESFAEARTVLRTLQFEVILATEYLTDGSGFQLAREMGPQSASLYVDVSLSEGHLWLPVVERGANTLGERALDSANFEQELGELLSGRSASQWASQRAVQAKKRPWPKLKLRFELGLPTDSPSLLRADDEQMALAATVGAAAPARGKKKS